MENILIIEDSETGRSAIISALNDLPYKRVFALDGANALARLSSDIYSLIISSYPVRKASIEHFLKAIRADERHKKMSVFLIAEALTTQDVNCVAKFGRVRLFLKPINEKDFAEKVQQAVAAFIEARKNQNEPEIKTYVFTPQTIDQCQKAHNDTLERTFLNIHPSLLEQVDPESINFGIWVRGTKEAVEYIDPKFGPSKNREHLDQLRTALQRLRGAVKLYVKHEERQTFFDHLRKNRLEKMKKLNRVTERKAIVDLFGKVADCSTKFMAKDVDPGIMSAAEGIAMDVVQQISENESMAEVLVELLNKDKHFLDHISVVNIIALLIGKTMQLPDMHLKTISMSCMFHDIGLTAFSVPVFSPKGLSAEDLSLYREHPSAGIDELNELEAKDVIIPEEVFHVTLQHHEKFNGTGFPNGKKGRLTNENVDGIHPFALIVALADRFAIYLNHEGEQGRETSPQKAFAAISRLHGDFDPKVVEALDKAIGGRRTKTVEVDKKTIQVPT